MHATGISLDRISINFSTSEKATISSSFLLNLGFPHAENGAIEKDIFPPGKFGMKAGPHFKKRPDASKYLGSSSSGFRDTRQDLEESAFPSTVSTDKADDFAVLNFERNVLEGPDRIRWLRAVCPAVAVGTKDRAQSLCNRIAQRIVTLPCDADFVLLERPSTRMAMLLIALADRRPQTDDDSPPTFILHGFS